MKKKIFVICALALFTTGCGKIPKLSNGDDAVITYKNGEMISVDDLYEKVKENYALEALITLSDTYILETEFKDYIDTAKEYAESYINAFIEQYGGEEEFIKAIQQAGYSTIDAYQEYMYLSYMQSHAIEEYAKSQLTDEEIETFYKDIKGDVELSHILVTADVKDDMTDEDKEKAEKKAKDTVKEIIEKLKKAEDPKDEFKKLVKEYSEDESTKEKDGSLGKITYGDLDKNYDELLDVAYKLKDGSYSTSVITTELGYHVIYKTKSHEKESLKDLKDEIKDELSQKLISSQRDISVTALQHYRKEYGMEIQDSELQKQYATYIQNMLANFQTSNNTTE